MQNLFLKDDRVLIGDFGLSKPAKDITHFRLGTPLNMAPELIDCENETKFEKTDIWSIGVVFYRLIFGKYPFFGLILGDLYQKIKKNNGKNMTFPDKPDISNITKNLISKMLEMDPKKRISWEELFSHPYFIKKFK